MADFGTLRIRFHSGAEYSYDKVPNQLAVDFFESESKGKFFHANISRVYEGVRNLDNELQADLEKRMKLLEDIPAEALVKVGPGGMQPVPEDIPISELFNEVAEDLPAELPVLANEVKIDEPILPQTYRERA